MKNLISYINENNTSINEAKDVNELKKIIQNAKEGDLIDYLWGVTEAATKPKNSGAYLVDCIIHLEKRKGDKFVAISNFIFGGNDLINKACKSEGWDKLRRFFDFGTVLTTERVIKLIDILPRFFNNYMNDKPYVKALSFDYDEIIKTCAKMSKPYKIKTLEDEIKNIEDQMQQLNDKKAQLEKLKNSKDDE